MSSYRDPRREAVARACRILATEGLVTNTLGHVSARVGDDQLLVRCRTGNDEGLGATTVDDIRLVGFDGSWKEVGGRWRVPAELPIHVEVYRARPDVAAVVHAHPPAVLVCGIAGLELRPIFGAFDIPAMRLAVDGVPIYPRSVLIRRADLACEMLEAMGERPVVVLRGHGITTTGASVAEATVAAVDLNTLATVTAQVAAIGRTAVEVPAEDLAELPDLGSQLNTDLVWNCLAARARRATGQP